MDSAYIRSLHNRLLEKANPGTRAWWEGYVKDSAPFLGVKMGDIRTTVHSWYQDQIAEILDLDQQLDLALLLFEGQYTEEKLAGTLYLQEILLPIDALNCPTDLSRLDNIFTNGLIYDWNICDWFSIKVLGSLIKKYESACSEGISAWHDSDNLWQARASLVAYVPVAGHNEYYSLIEISCNQIIKRDERFAKTAVGWILRDLSKYDQGLVERVIRQNIKYFSVESLKNATKYFEVQDKNVYRKLLREAQTD
jgi:3-methyladenine DNA glycosylase AlkD